MFTYTMNYTYLCCNVNNSLLYMQNGQHPIHLASGHGEVEMVRALIRMGASPTAVTDDEVGLLDKDVY